MFGIDHYAQKETLFLAGGVALAVMGAGLILSIPEVRKFIEHQAKNATTGGAESIPAKLGGVLPDLQRYLRIREM